MSYVYVRHKLKDLEIKLARCGTVAWFYCVSARIIEELRPKEAGKGASR